MCKAQDSCAPRACHMLQKLSEIFLNTNSKMLDMHAQTSTRLHCRLAGVGRRAEPLLVVYGIELRTIQTPTPVPGGITQVTLATNNSCRRVVVFPSGVCKHVEY